MLVINQYDEGYIDSERHVSALKKVSVFKIVQYLSSLPFPSYLKYYDALTFFGSPDTDAAAQF